MSVLVTGAQGFLGAWLVERLLADGEHVVVPDRPAAPGSRFEAERLRERCEVAALDVADPAGVLEVLRAHGVRSVFHLASQSIAEVAERDPRSTWEVNVRGTYCVLDACRRAADQVERVVVASSARAYGPPLDRPFCEHDALRAVDPYGASKAAADIIARAYAASQGVPVAVVRMANVYGGGDVSFTRLVPDACRALAAGERPVLRSDGSPERELVYAADAVEAYLAIAASLDDPARAGRAWNVGSGEAPAVGDVVRRLIRIAGRDLEPDVRGEPRAGRDRHVLDSTAVRDELRWAPAWDLDRGLAATWEWYVAHLAGDAAGPRAA
jgi:CDP-glucose 4,6-dehydratase